MNSWNAVENALVQTLAGLALNGQTLLPTVKSCTLQDRKLLMAAISRENMPAAYLTISGREAGDKDMRRPGPVAFTLLLAERSLRSEDNARRGASDVTGVFAVGEHVAVALQDLMISGDRRVLLVDERPVGVQEGAAFWEQRYELRRQSDSTSAPTFGGVALAGAGSEIHVELGSLQRAKSRFSFPGVDGVFERDLGVRERTITWRGQLRAINDAALNAIESAIEAELRSGQEKTLIDAWGRGHETCVLESFERRGARLRDNLKGDALQDFEMVFTQLGR